MSAPELVVLSVVYRNPDDARAMAASFAALEENARAALVFVDNSEDPAAFQALRDGLPRQDNIRALAAPRNLGYLGAAAWALEQLGERPRWTAVANCDLSFPEPGFVRRLLALDDEAGVVAPAILDARSGRDQNPFMRRRPSRFRMHWYKWVFRWILVQRAYHLIVPPLVALRRHRPAPPGEVYAPQGAFMLFHRRYFEAGGRLDGAPFLFGEEVVVAEAARAAGVKVVYDPSLVVTHARHSALRRAPSALIARYKAESAAFCADRYFKGR